MSPAEIAEPLSPELVLVAPELRQQALSRLPAPAVFVPAKIIPLGPARTRNLPRAAVVYSLVASLRTLALAVAVASAFALLAIAAQLTS